MSEHKLTVDVYAHCGEGNPRYRVFVDNDLLTERDFTWPGHEIFIRENIIVNLNPGSHILKVEQINTVGTIQVKNVTVDGIASATNFIIPE